MFVGHEILLGASYPEARAGLVRLTHGGWLSDASDGAYAEGLAGLVRVGPFGDMPGASKLVRVLLLEPVERDGCLTLSLRWEATGAMDRLFPVLDANIILIPAGENQCQLALAGAYRPPFAAAGERLDRALLHRVASATARSLLRRIAETIASAGVAVTEPSPATPSLPLEAGLEPRPETSNSIRPGLPVAWAGVREPAEELAGHPDRLRWNARYAEGSGASFVPHPLAVLALSVPPPDGPVADLASGPSGAALLAARAGRRVTAVDISDVALGLLGAEAGRLGLRDRITLVQADLPEWRPAAAHYALVLCTGYWDRAAFATAMTAVAPGGLLGWEAFTAAARRTRPGLCPQWCLGDGEPASLLHADFEVLDTRDVPDGARGAKRSMLARHW
jgi:Methyltransferase domain